MCRWVSIPVVSSCRSATIFSVKQYKHAALTARSVARCDPSEPQRTADTRAVQLRAAGPSALCASFQRFYLLLLLNCTELEILKTKNHFITTGPQISETFIVM